MPVPERKNVQKIRLYTAARTMRSICDKYGFQESEIIKLAGNENRLGCSPRVIKALEAHAGEFSFYPDTNYTDLRDKLVKKHGIDGDHLIFGNGSFELLSLIGQAYLEEGDEVITVSPSFGWYRNVTELAGASLIQVPVDEEMQTDPEKIAEAISPKTKVIFLCNPNNPTGAVIPGKKLRWLAEQVPEDVLLVLDEAYIDFIEGPYPNTVDLVRNSDHVILLRTFSKTAGLASFRIGYGIAAPAVIQALTKVKLPINVNFAAAVAASASLDDREFERKVIENNQRGRKIYYQAFEKLGFSYVPSNGNFVLVHTGIDGGRLEEEFLRYGIMIRNGADFGLPDWLRISVGTEEENRKVTKALQEIVEKIRREEKENA